MISYEEALAIVKREFEKLATEIIKVPLEEAGGYLLAEDVYTDTFLPPFNNSSMDGFAVKYTPRKTKWKIIGEISAGNYEDFILDENSAVRIMTGGKVPGNADTVIPLEDVLEENGSIELNAGTTYRHGQDIRKKGEDITPGVLVLHTGTLLKPQNTSIAAACGKAELKVYDRIKVGVLATGDELIDISSVPEGDKIRATNLYSLISLVKSSGMKAVNLGVTKDNKEALAAVITSALKSDINILITTGGVSVGKYDYLKDIYKEIGAEIYFTKVNIKPGKPVVFGRAGKKLIFGLPGNPVSSFVSFIIFIREALNSKYNKTPISVTAELSSPLKKNDTKKHFIRGILEYDSSCKKYYVKECGAQSSGNMAGLNTSNCLIVIPEEKINPSAGEIVECIVL